MTLGECSCSVYILLEQANLESVIQYGHASAVTAEWLNSASKAGGLGKYLLYRKILEDIQNS